MRLTENDQQAASSDAPGSVDIYESAKQMPDIVKKFDGFGQTLTDIGGLVKALKEDNDKNKEKMTEFEKKMEQLTKEKTKEDEDEKGEKQEKKKEEEDEKGEKKEDKDKPKKTSYPYPEKEMKKFQEDITKTFDDKFNQMLKSIKDEPESPAAPATDQAAQDAGPIQKFSAELTGTGNPETNATPKELVTDWAHRMVNEEGLDTPEKYAEEIRGFQQRNQYENSIMEFDEIYGSTKDRHLDLLS